MLAARCMVTGEELRVPKAVKEAGRMEQRRLEEVDKIKGTRRKGNTRVINYHSFAWAQGVHLGEVRGPRQGVKKWICWGPWPW